MLACGAASGSEQESTLLGDAAAFGAAVAVVGYLQVGCLEGGGGGNREGHMLHCSSCCTQRLQGGCVGVWMGPGSVVRQR